MLFNIKCSINIVILRKKIKIKCSGVEGTGGMDESHRKPVQLNKRTSLGKFMTQLSDYKMLLKFNKQDEKYFPGAIL